MSKNPLETYKHYLQNGILHSDPVQEEAIQAFQCLYEGLEEFAQKTSLSWVQRLGRKGPSAPRGIYLHGGVGRGKSMLMDLFFECLPDEILARRVHFHEFMLEIHDYLHQRRAADDFSSGIDGALPALADRIFERSRVLCFDEFHVSDVADAMILGRLFTALFEHGVVVVATSNWHPDMLYEDGLQRDRFLPFIELLKKRMRIIHLDSSLDYRAQLLKSEGTYFTPLGRVTNKKLNEVFAYLIEGACVSQEGLEVKGRRLPVACVANGVARFTFAQLCEQPYGSQDYITIAQRYHTVFLEGVPKMGYDRRNEIKRLMILIDVLYDKGTKLIVSAESMPDKLYYGHDYEFEFQRTISRLKEMQSEAYLKRG